MSDCSAAPLALRLLGPFEAFLHGRPTPPLSPPAPKRGRDPSRLRSRKVQWLLALLVLRAGREVERDLLIATLWPESDETAALANLRSSLKDLRRALGPEAVRLSSSTRRTLSLDLTGAEVDLVAFDRAIASGSSEALEVALSLYRGPLLEGCAEEWIAHERAMREEAYLAALERLAERAMASGDPDRAVTHLRRAVAVDPLRESAQRVLMQALTASGSYAAALLVYRELRLLLHREMNAEPDPETQALYRQLRTKARGKAALGSGLWAPGKDEPQLEGPAASPRLYPEPRAQSPELPEGTVTFLFTDIERSTHLWEQQPKAMDAALARHDALAAVIIEQYEGALVKRRGEGDSLFAVFARAADAVEAACALQLAFVAEPWPLEMPLRVRMALHTGDATLREGDYYGPAVNRCARLRATAHGGQVVLARATQELVQDDLPEPISLRDLGLHRLRDLQRAEQVFQLLHPELPAEFPPLQSLDALPNNLPHQATRFIGRDREIDEVKRLLAGTRLLTVTGAGGTGKTRLALQAAADLLPEYAEGVWLVEMAPLADPTLVPQAVAMALGVREEPGKPQSQTLADALKPKRLLLIMDNCEHLLDACAALAEVLLRGCPGVRLLATSREGLGIGGETVYRLRSLSLPDPGKLPPALEDLSQYEAVSLFIDRATAVLPAFEITDENAPAVAAICCRLDGIPLALELAAARVKALPVETISERLDDRFRLLTGGSRTALPRQRTLRALIDWSYDLLTPPERELLSRLSVFAGGWSVESAEEVCSDDERPTTTSSDQRWGTGGGSDVGHSSAAVGRDEVLDLLTSLVDKSLVIFEESQARYHLLETVRRYAWDRLQQTGRLEMVRSRHLQFFLELAEEAEPHLRGPDQIAWFDRLSVEHDNLRAALEWSRSGGVDPDVGLRLTGALWWFWAVRGHWQEGRDWLLAALEQAGPAVRTPGRVKALLGAVDLLSLFRERELGTHLGEEALALCREWGDRRGTALALNLLSEHLGDLERSEPYWEQSLALAREVEDHWVAARSLAALAFVARERGEATRALAMLEEVVALSRAIGDLRGTEQSLFRLAVLIIDRGDYARADRLLEESLALSRAVDDRLGVIQSLNEMTRSAMRQGEYERAAILGAEGLAASREKGWGITYSLLLLAELAARRGANEEAARLYGETLQRWATMELLTLVAHTLARLGEVAAALNEPERAARLFGAAVALRETRAVPPGHWTWPPEERWIATTRSALGDEAFNAAWDAGRALDWKTAVAYALEDDKEA